MKTFTTILSTYEGFRYGKTHAIRKIIEHDDPADMEYLSECGRKANHLLVAIDLFPVTCHKCNQMNDPEYLPDTRPERHDGYEVATDQVLKDMALEDALDEFDY